MNCTNDRTYQASLNTIEAHWSIPDNMTSLATDFHFSVESRSPVGSLWNKNCTTPLTQHNTIALGLVLFRRVLHIHVYISTGLTKHMPTCNYIAGGCLK